MSYDHDKSAAQFWTAILSIAALALTTVGSLVADQVHGRTSQITPLLAGGLISITTACAGWLFRNGNGSTPSEPPVNPPAF